MRLLGVGLLVTSLAAARAFADCGASQSASSVTHEVKAAGLTTVHQKIAVPPASLVIITALEDGLDSRLEVDTSPGVVAGSDSPVRRRGPQRLLIASGERRDIDVRITGKESASGRTILSVEVLPPMLVADGCTRALRLMAEGDGHYDAAQSITRARGPRTAVSARTHYAAAAEAYQRAAQTLAGVPPSPLLAEALLAEAWTRYRGLDDYAAAAAPAAAAVQAFTKLVDPAGRDRARFMLAATQMEIVGNDRQAKLRAELLDIARSHAARGERYDEAVAINLAGVSLQLAREYEDSIRLFTQAHAIFDRLGERARKGQVLQNIALSQHDLARPGDAREYYLEALALIDPDEDPKLIGDITNNLALSEFRMGRVDEALTHYSQALELFERIQIPREQARSLLGIGVTYHSVGKRQEGVEYMLRSLELRTPELDKAGRIATLRALAESERQASRPGRAAARREEALALASSPALRNLISIELAMDLVDDGRLDRGEEILKRVFASGSLDRIMRARALFARARQGFAAKRFADVERDAAEASARFRQLELPALAFSATMLRAEAACGRGDHRSAATLVERAMKLSEELRGRSGNPAFRASSWQALRPAFDLAIRVFARPGSCGGGAQADARASLLISERARGRALNDFRRIAVSARGTSGGINRQRQQLYSSLATERATLELLAERPEPPRQRMKAVRERIAAIQRKLDLMGGQAGADSGDLLTMDSLQSAAERIRPDTAVVEYWLGDSESYAWLITLGRVQMIPLGETARIDAAARNLGAAMRDFNRVPPRQRLEASRILSALIIGKLPAELRAARRVHFIPDGLLHGVPFSALVLEQAGRPEYLIEGRDISVAASLHGLADDATPLELESRPVLVVADPVYGKDDPRFADPRTRERSAAASRRFVPTLRGPLSPGRWERLEGSGREAAAIAAQLQRSKVRIVTGFDAHRGAMLDADLSQYHVLHFATHAVADLEAPQLSALVLSTVDERGNARIGEVFAGDIVYRPIDAQLVVFSGCETALGQSMAGEGLFGLRYAAHAAGARAVVSSLWPVVDRVGEQIMADFYSAMGRDRLPPDAALSRAMRMALAKWPDPALWSVFEVSRVARRGREN